MTLTPDEVKVFARIMVGPDNAIFRGFFERALYLQDCSNRNGEGPQLHRGQGRSALLSDLIETFDNAVQTARSK